MLLQLGEVFRERPILLLRPHYEEICKRYKKGEDTRPGTKAEVLAGLLGASLRCPLNNTANALINKLGIEVLGKDFEIPHHESLPDAVDQAFEFCRRKLAQPDRMLPKDRDKPKKLKKQPSPVDEPIEALLESMGLALV